jgi:cytochrome P450
MSSVRLRAVYDKFRSSIITLVAFNSPQTIYSISNPEAVRILTTDRRRWAKPVESYRVLALYGDNVLTTEGGEWRKHRKVHEFGWYSCSLVTN